LEHQNTAKPSEKNKYRANGTLGQVWMGCFALNPKICKTRRCSVSQCLRPSWAL